MLSQSQLFLVDAFGPRGCVALKVVVARLTEAAVLNTGSREHPGASHAV
jgi:hypothetical protein